jgi:hypothetical protein
VFVKVGYGGADIIVKLFEYVIVLVGQSRQKIFLAGDKIETLHQKHKDDEGER